MANKFKQNVVEYKEIEGGHLQFLIGKDEDYFTNHILGWMNKFNPIH